MDSDFEPPTEQEIAEDARAIRGFLTVLSVIGGGVAVITQFVRAFESTPPNQDALGAALMMLGFVVVATIAPICNAVARKSLDAARATMIALFGAAGLLAATATLIGVQSIVEAVRQHHPIDVISVLFLVAMPIALVVVLVRARRKWQKEQNAA